MAAELYLWEDENTDKEKPSFSFPGCEEKSALSLDEDDEKIQVPASISQYLRPYQREGVKFMYSHYKQNEGCVLADDMGLGKTIQVIALLSALLNKKGTKEEDDNFVPAFIRQLSNSNYQCPSVCLFLIVCPAFVMFNWLDELETWGYFRVGKYYQTQREETLRKIFDGRLEVVLTSFETARDQIDELNTVDWSGIIVDEAHKIKEPKAQVTIAFKSLKCRRRIGLTGTALQNNLKELWCLLDWANPGCLGPLYQFSEEYERVIEAGQRHDITKRELAEARRAKEKLQIQRNLWLLRRKKDIIKDQLPSKTDQVVFCLPSEFQTSVYKAILDCDDVKFIMQQWDGCGCHSDRKRGKCCYKVDSNGRSTKELTFTYMHLLLKTANHVALLLPSSSKSEKQVITSRAICQVAFKQHEQFVKLSREKSFQTMSDPQYSGKMMVLVELLDVFHQSKDKILLFSYSTVLLTILEKFIQKKGYEYRRLDGTTKGDLRGQFVKEFNCDPSLFIFLISTRAGGLGLNVTGANVVIIFDPSWNPAHDLQAQDRAYRIGQRRNVRVYRLITAGSIEENIYLRQVYKQQLDQVAIGNQNSKRYFRGVQGDKEQRGELFGFRNMFTLRTDSCLTKDILDRQKGMEQNLTKDHNKLYRMDDYVIQYNKKTQVQKDLEADDLEDLIEEYDNSDDDDDIESESDDVTNDKSNDPVDNILKSGRVVHMHYNKDIVGGSKIEDHVTHCAIEDVYKRKVATQEPAIHCRQMSLDDAIKNHFQKKRQKRKRVVKPSVDGPRKINLDSKRILLYGQTPPYLQRQQLECMASWENVSVGELCQRIINMTQSDKLKLLCDFYASHHNDNQHVITLYDELIEQSTESETNLNRTVRSESENESDTVNINEARDATLKRSKVRKVDKEKEVSYMKSKRYKRIPIIFDDSSDDGDLNKPCCSKQLTSTPKRTRRKRLTSFNDSDSDTSPNVNKGVCNKTNPPEKLDKSLAMLDKLLLSPTKPKPPPKRSSTTHTQVPPDFTPCTSSALDSIFFTQNSLGKFKPVIREPEVTPEDVFSTWVKSKKLRKVDKK